MSETCVARNNKGRRCTRVPAANSVLCALHERRPSSEAEYLVECDTFLEDVYKAGRRANREVLLALLVLAFDDDDIRQEFLSIVESVAGDVRRAKSASASRPHAPRQNRTLETQPQGGTRTQPADPPPPSEDDDVEIIFEDVTEDI
jgi:hypothetical protein